MDSENYGNFDSDQQMFNFIFDSEEFDKMLQSFNEEQFNKPLQKLEELAQSLQGTTEVKTHVLNKRKRKRPVKIIQDKGSPQKVTQLKANTANVNNYIDLCESTPATVPINGSLDTKGKFYFK
nr:uncharacterized protein LOC118682275 [Bactrocera oleae]